MARGGRLYLPGILYDLAFSRLFRGLRERVARAVESEGLYPWLDVCCGTGSQLRGIGGPPTNGRGPAVCGLDNSLGFVRYAASRAPGVPFVCGDAARLPFKDGSFRAVSVSFGLHDKGAEIRRAVADEARRVLDPEGRFIAVDFERPWSRKSRRGALVTAVIERFAPRDHYRNGRDFVRRGGLRSFLEETGFPEVSRHSSETGSLSVVVCRRGGGPSET